MNTKNTLTVPQPLVRLNNVITIAIIVSALLAQLPFVILIPTIYFGIGAFFGKNPIILLGKAFLPKGKKYVMEDKEQLKFNSLLAFMLLALSLVFYYLGLPVVYYILIIMCAAANLGSAFGYCIGCVVRFQWKQYQYRRSIK